MVLDLSPGAQVKITKGHNIQGARQPKFMHIDAKKKYKGKAPVKPVGRMMRNDGRHEACCLLPAVRCSSRASPPQTRQAALPGVVPEPTPTPLAIP